MEEMVAGCSDVGDSPGVGGIHYGTIDGMDIQMGSSGGSSDNTFGGSGGGTITINSTIVKNNGIVDLSGDNGPIPGGSRGGGGGSGGGLKILCSELTNSGSIVLDGGNGSIGTQTANDDGGGGAGGRVKLFYETNPIQNNISVNGGIAGINGSVPGEAGDTGTIYNSVTQYLGIYNIGVQSSNNQYDTININSYLNYTSPSGNYIWTNSGNYFDTIMNTFGCKKYLTIFLTIYNDPNPEILHYKFNENDTIVTNYAYFAPVGTETASINGGFSQGGNGQCGGALLGYNGNSNTDYVNTNWITNLSNTSWTISFWTSNIQPSLSVNYIFGDNTAISFRCFTNGVAGANNWIVRGPINELLITGAATTAPTLTTIVYDRSANQLRAYVNGVLNNTVTQNPVNIIGTSPFKVGGYGSNLGLQANSFMDEFRLYSRALSPTEVADLANLNDSVYISTNICYSYTSPSGNYTWTTSGLYSDTLQNSSGCDSILFINLTINTNTYDTIYENSYLSYTTPSGNYTYTTSGIYNDTIPNIYGCLSFLTINLTIRDYNNPEILHYKFNENDTIVTNYAYFAPVGTETASINGGFSQGGNGQCGGALLGYNGNSNTDYVNTNWITNLSNTSWTISFWTSNIQPSLSVNYIFGDNTAISFRCFTNGVAGANNWIVRGPINELLITGAATTAPTLTTIVYDRSANQLRAYVNGVLNNTVTQNPVNIIGTSPFKVGGYGSNLGLPANSFMDEFRIYSRALSPTEIANLANLNDSVYISTISCYSYTSPSGNYIWSASGLYSDTLQNSSGCDSIIYINLTIPTIDTSITKTGITLTANQSGATYKWLNCDNSYQEIAGETAQSFTATANGNYALVVTIGACSDTSSCYNIVGVGIPEYENEFDIVLKPNPSDGKFSVITKEIVESIEISDVVGNLVQKIFPKNKNINVDLKNRNSGIYFIKVIGKQKSKTIRIVINQ